MRLQNLDRDTSFASSIPGVKERRMRAKGMESGELLLKNGGWMASWRCRFRGSEILIGSNPNFACIHFTNNEGISLSKVRL